MKHVFTLLLFALATSPANATVYPPHFGSNSDIFVIDQGEDDVYLKHVLFENAYKSIEMMTHVQTTGPVGGLVVDDLRKAMSRGVKVRFLFEGIATMTGGGEFNVQAARYLADSRYYRNGSELVIQRVGERLRSPFALNDLVHKKIIIVDRGTPHEMVIITGRNNHEVNYRWSDLTFVIRRVDDSKPYVGDDIIKDFDRTWDFSRKYFSAEKPVTLSEKEKAAYLKIPLKQPKPTQLGLSVEKAIAKDPVPGETLADFQFRPENVRIVTTDVLSQIEAKQLPKTLGTRKGMYDDVVDYLSESLKQAKRAEANIYALMLPEKIREGIYSLVERGGEMTILTNSAQSLGSALPIPPITEAIASFGHRTLVGLHGKMPDPKSNKVNMYAMVPGQAEDGSPQEATHRKMWVLEFPNGRKLSFFGSHNLTTASTSKSDELMIAAWDNRLADYLSELNKRETKGNYRQVTLEEAKAVKRSTRILSRMCKGLFESIY